MGALGEMIAVSNVGVMVDFGDDTAVYGSVKSSKTGKKLAYDSCSIKYSRQFIENRSITGRRTRQAKVVGNADMTGRLVVKQTIDTLPFFWKAILGSLGTAANAGSGAAPGTVTLSGGGVATVPVTTPGTGYIYPPAVTFTGGTGAGGTEAYAVLTADAVTSVVVVKPGAYTVAPTAVFTNNNLHSVTIGADLPTLVVQITKPFGTVQYDLFTGCRISTWSVKIMSTGYYILEMDVIGGVFSTSTTNYDGSAADYASGKMVHHALLPKATVLLDGVAATYADFLDITINGSNNLDTADYPVGGIGFRAGLTPDDTESKLSGTLRVLSQTRLNTFNDEGDHTLGLTWKFPDLAFFHSLSMAAVQFDPTNAVPDARGSFKMPFTAEGHENASGVQISTTTSNAKANAAYL